MTRVIDWQMEELFLNSGTCPARQQLGTGSAGLGIFIHPFGMDLSQDLKVIKSHWFLLSGVNARGYGYGLTELHVIL